MLGTVLKAGAGILGKALGGGKKESPKIPEEKGEQPKTWQRVAKVIGEGIAPSYAKGGRVRKTGLAKLHKGEMVLTKRQAKRQRKSCGK